MTAEERRAESYEFKAALESGVIRKGLDAIERQLTAEWKIANTTDERENLHRSVRILGLLRSHMASIAAGEPDGGISAIKRVK